MKKKVIVSTDAGWDDVLSLLYLMKHPDIEIVGVVVTGCGETNLRWGTMIAKTLMELGNQKNAKVCLGRKNPLQYDHVFPQSFRDDMNDIMGLLGSLNPTLELPLYQEPGWDFMAETIRDSQEKITILALGGFTDLAEMLIQNPSVVPKLKNIEAIYAMAGAVYVDGNVAALNNAKEEWNQGPIYSSNYYAEWNVFVDPLAARNVIQSKIPLVMIPLDACDYVVLSGDYSDIITAKDPLADLARKIFTVKSGGHSEGIPVPIFDPLATMIMAGGLKNYQTQYQYLDVVLKESKRDNHCGKTFVTDSGSRKIAIVQGVSQTEFAKNYAEIMNRSL